jgi:MIP family channel proteins
VPAPPYSTRLVAELVGTFGFFFLGFCGIAATIDEPTAIGIGGVAAGFGLGLALMIFAFGHISGGHFNPAVSLGLAIGRQFPWTEVVGYWIAQLIGGVAAAAVAGQAFGAGVEDALLNQPSGSDAQSFWLELVATALFLIVISAVATDSRAPWYGVFAPIAIGGFIFTAATVVGPFTSGSFNPARSIAPAILAGDATNLWIYIAGPFVGGIIGGLVFWALRRSPGSEVEGEELTSEAPAA